MKSASNKGNGLYLTSIVLVAVLGGILFGYDTAVISGAESGLQAFFMGAKDFTYTNFLHGITSSSALSDAEVITTMILFHLCGYKCLKHFYIDEVCKNMKDLFSKLFVDGIQLVTKLKSNMKGQIMSVSDRVLLRKRALIETINDELKNMAQIEHTRHRSVTGFTVNLMAGLAAYSFFPKKPMIGLERVSPYENALIQLSLF